MSNRFTKRQDKRKIQADRKIEMELPAGSIDSSWEIVEREFMFKDPTLPAGEVRELVREGRPCYSNREGFTQIFR